jgi:putative N-acetylmannosamine-6-phosphate epimerase
LSWHVLSEAGKIMSEVLEKLRTGAIAPCQAVLGGLMDQAEIAAAIAMAALYDRDPQRESEMADIVAITEARVAIDARAQIAATKLAGGMSDSKSIAEPRAQWILEQATAHLTFFAEGRVWDMSEEARCVALNAEIAFFGTTIAHPGKITRRYAVAKATKHRLGETV